MGWHFVGVFRTGRFLQLPRISWGSLETFTRSRGDQARDHGCAIDVRGRVSDLCKEGKNESDFSDGAAKPSDSW